MSGKGLVTRPVGPGERDEWDKLAAEHGCIFDSFRWAEVFGSSLARIGIYDRGDNLKGGFCVYQQRRFGLRVLRNPPFTRQIGPFFKVVSRNPAARTNEERAIVCAMEEYLTSQGAAVMSLGLSLGIVDCLPFFWGGWKVVPRYTYRIPLAPGNDELLGAMSMQQRNHIKKAERDGVCVEAVPDTVELRRLVVKTFERQGKAFPMAEMDRIFAAYPVGDSAYSFISRKDGIPIAGVYVVNDSQTAYNLLTGYDHERAHHGAGALAMWYAILKAKEIGLEQFDFEGSAIPPIERYFRGFGGSLTPIFSVHRAWLPLEIVLKLVRRALF
jgi:hypothetical protein